MKFGLVSKKSETSIDSAVDAMFTLMEKGVKVQLDLGGRCGHCGMAVMRSNPSPNWMNRFTCQNCGKHQSH